MARETVRRRPARADRGAAARPAGSAARHGRAAGRPGASPHRRRRRRAGGRGGRRAAAAARVQDGARAGASAQRAGRLGARRPPRSTGSSHAASTPARASGCRCSSRTGAIGVISAYDKLSAPDARFTDDDVRLAEIFATRAAVAVELSERVERDALRRVVSAQELERRRLARELHDETGQALTSILLGLKQLEGSESPEAVAAAARTRRGDAAGRTSARGRTAAEGARRLRPRSGARAPDARLRRADRASPSTSRPARSPSGCRSRSRRPSTGSSRRRSRTWSSTRAPNGSACWSHGWMAGSEP